MSENLLQKLEQYGRSDWYPLHMPGHKRQISHFGNPFQIDITEIEGFDNLFHAQDVLLEAQQRAARLYGAEETYYLVNGSTCGILAAVSASVKRGGRILMARNSHKAAYHAVLLNGLHVDYLYPETDLLRGINRSIRPEAVEEALERDREIEAVLITSPTYDGVVSDIRQIAAAAHRAGAVLIVDEAHGAHFGLYQHFPEAALACGADIVINSLHKTLPSLTQTALLHVKGPWADRKKIRKYLGIYQSSSPSYVLMAGMDACIGLLQRQGKQLFDTFWTRLMQMRSALQGMQALHLVDGREPELSAFGFDPSKVLISTEHSGINGPELAEILRREYHLEPEMEAEHYVTAIMTIGDTQEGFERLERALLETDGRLTRNMKTTEDGAARKAGAVEDGAVCKAGVINEVAVCKTGAAEDGTARKSGAVDEPAAHEMQADGGGVVYGASEPKEEVLSIGEAEDSLWEVVPLEKSGGRISAEFAYLYPPGIPFLVPGERIPDALPEKLRYYQAIGLHLQGMDDYTGKTIRVVLANPAEGKYNIL